MNSLHQLPDATLLEQTQLTEAEFDELESELALRAACLSWTGDPISQPVEAVAAIVRAIISRRS